MKIPRLWAKELVQVTDPPGKTLAFAVWRWSEDSFADAAPHRAKVHLEGDGDAFEQLRP